MPEAIRQSLRSHGTFSLDPRVFMAWASSILGIMGLPRDDAFIADLDHIFKHVVEFDRKRELYY
jgi:hypothetical protein